MDGESGRHSLNENDYHLKSPVRVMLNGTLYALCKIHAKSQNTETTPAPPMDFSSLSNQSKFSLVICI